MGYGFYIANNMLHLSDLTTTKDYSVKLYDLYKKSHTNSIQVLSKECHIRIESPFKKECSIDVWTDLLDAIKNALYSSGINIYDGVTVTYRDNNIWVMCPLNKFHVRNAADISKLCRRYNSSVALLDRISVSPEYDDVDGVKMYVKRCNVSNKIEDDTLKLLEKEFDIINYHNMNEDNENSLIIAEIKPKNIPLL